MATNTKLLTIFNGPYTDRITVFIDILGFSRDVIAIPARPGLLISVEAVLSRIRNCKKDIDRARAKSVKFDARMTFFSDCIILSYSVENGAVFRAIADAAFLSRVLLAGGYLPRGAITIGRLTHTEDIVFGDALVAVAEEEKCRVDTPRIKLMPIFATLLQKEFSLQGNSGMEFIRDQGDGRFVHILGNQWPFIQQELANRVKNNIAGSHIDELYSEMRAALAIRFQNAPHDRARIKNEWMRDYVNDTIDEQNLSPDYKINF